MVNKRLKYIIRIGISCLFVGYLAFKVDWTLVLRALGHIDLLLYFVSALLALPSSLLLAFKYYLLIRDTSISRSLVSLIKINFIIRFYSLLLPSSVGTEAIRWYKVTRNQNGRLLFMASTIFERLVFIFVLLIFGFFPLFYYSSYPEITILRDTILPPVILVMCLLIAAIAYFFFPVIRYPINDALNWIVPSRWRRQNITSILNNFSLSNPTFSLFALTLGLSLAGHIFFLCRLFALVKSAYLPLSFLDVSWMGSLVLLLQVLPISFAGIGIREGGYAYLFTVLELPPEKGVLIGILLFSQMLIFAIIGGIFDLLEK